MKKTVLMLCAITLIGCANTHPDTGERCQTKEQAILTNILGGGLLGVGGVWAKRGYDEFEEGGGLGSGAMMGWGGMVYGGIVMTGSGISLAHYNMIARCDY